MSKLRLVSLFLFVGTLTFSCEKIELEDHCPEEEFYVPVVNPGDVKSNSGSDKEESNGFSLSASIDDGPDDSVTSRGDDLINDDSDNEDESQTSRTPSSDDGSSSDLK
jgi:hypothetical protein